MSKQNLNEEISRIKRLLNISESSVIEEANPIVDIIKRLVPKLERQFITAVETKLGKKIGMATDAEIATALKSAEMATLRKEIAKAVYSAEKAMIDDVFTKYNMSVAGEAAQAYTELQKKGLNKAILRDVASEYRATKSVANTVSNKPATVMSGGLNNLPAVVTSEEIMKHVEADPVFSAILKNKKGTKEVLEKWIDVNVGDKVSKESIIAKLEPWFERAAKSPDKVTAESASKISKVFKVAKLGGEAASVTKGILGWSFVIMTILIVTGVITLKDAIKFYLCKVGFGPKTSKILGCDSSSGDSGSASGSSGGTLTPDQY